MAGTVLSSLNVFIYLMPPIMPVRQVTIIASHFTCEESEVQTFSLICSDSQEISSRVLV